MAETSIQWADYTFNPWIGCQRVSPGCEHCYAETLDSRKRWEGRAHWGPKAPRYRTSVSTWRNPLTWNRKAKTAGARARVFCASLADVFEDRPELAEWRADLFLLILATPHLDWMLLTKRPENIARLWPIEVVPPPGDGSSPNRWPNVWLGTTVEDQKRAYDRVDALLNVPAAVHFLSCEPLLEEVSLVPILGTWTPVDGAGAEMGPTSKGIDWVIIGGESGRGARPFDFAWARRLIRECKISGAAPFVKQLGANPHGEWGPGKPPKHHLIDITRQPPRESLELSRFKNGRWKLMDGSGGTPAEWPLDLRVREFPEVRR